MRLFGWRLGVAAALTNCLDVASSVVMRHSLGASCEARFDACWNRTVYSWSAGGDCEDSQASCEAGLCRSVALDRCGNGVWGQRCARIAQMCARPVGPWRQSSVVNVINVPMPALTETDMEMIHSSRLSPAPSRRVEEATAKNQVDPSKELFFIHIPKNGGTTIEDVAALAGIRWGCGYSHSLMRMRDGLTCNWWHVPPRYLPAPNPYEGKNTFCFVRHPYDRAVSEYTYLLMVPWGHYPNEAPTLYDHPPCSPEGLNAFLRTVLTFYMNGRQTMGDCHLIPQSEYVFDSDGRQWCNTLLSFDNFTDGFNALMRSHNLSPRLGSEGRCTDYPPPGDWKYPSCQEQRDFTQRCEGRRGGSITDGYCQKTCDACPASEGEDEDDDGKSNASAQRCPDLSRDDLADDVKELINVIYRQDFELLGFVPDVVTTSNT